MMTYEPIASRPSAVPFINQDIRYSSLCKDRFSTKCASGDKEDRIIDPNTVKPAEVLMH